MYEGGVRVPLFVAGAGVASPNRRVSALVSAVDLFPTILELAGIDAALCPPSDGRSFLPYLRAKSIPPQDLGSIPSSSRRGSTGNGSAPSAMGASS